MNGSLDGRGSATRRLTDGLIKAQLVKQLVQVDISCMYVFKS